MEVELTYHPGFEPHLEPPDGARNVRNGTTPKTLLTQRLVSDADPDFPQLLLLAERRMPSCARSPRSAGAASFTRLSWPQPCAPPSARPGTTADTASSSGADAPKW
jgi:hypothetical protein